MRIKLKFNNILIITANFFYKIKIGSHSSMLTEISVIKLILDSDISDILPDIKYNEKYIPYIKIEKLNHIEKHEKFLVFEYFQKKLNKYDRIEKTSISNHQHIENALNIFIEYFPLETSEKLISIVNIILEKPLFMGVVHGDLHTNNILKNRDNSYKLIDFDCFSFNRIKSFDVIYYIIELFHLENSLNWYLNFFKLLDRSDDINWTEYEKYLSKIHGSFDNLLFLFFLDRFGQENLDSDFSNETIYTINQLVKKLISNWNDTENNL